MSSFCQNSDSASASPIFVSHFTVQILLCERTWPRLGHGFGCFGSPGVRFTKYGCGYWVPTQGEAAPPRKVGIVTWAVTPFVDLMLFWF